jgi:hypothetical protein
MEKEGRMDRFIKIYFSTPTEQSLLRNCDYRIKQLMQHKYL